MILLVEDQTFVRQAMAAALTSSGYTVLIAADGAQALEACRDASQPIDLLVSDMVMPGMNGDELAKRFQAVHPSGRVLLMSGYAEELTSRPWFPSQSSCLRKPFSAGTLIKVVGELLEADTLALEIPAAKT